MIIRFSKASIKFLLRQTRKNAMRIIESILMLPKGDVVKLAGRDEYRLRVGSYRVIFAKDGSVISIEDIDNRGQIYKKR